MHPRIRCAVLAMSLPEESNRVRELLETVDFSEIVCVNDGRRALMAVRERLPDAVIADAVLPGLDGFELIRRIRSMSPEVVPSAMVLMPKGMRFSETGEGIGCRVAEKPLDEAKLARLLSQAAQDKSRMGERQRQKAVEILRKIGMPEHRGREYLSQAAELVWLDARRAHRLTKEVYPEIAEKNGVDVRHVERAMRYAIDAAWRDGEIDAQYELFGDTIDAKRGSPTCGEMIARIADILRWEGRV